MEDIEYLESLKRSHGTVEYKGKTLYLTHMALPRDATSYSANAIDEDGEEYLVVWQTVEGWEDHVCGEDGECVVEDCDGWCEDEEKACNWDEYEVYEMS